MNYIPYQLCPKCNGEGIINNNGLSTALTRQCDVCNGNKIIPMFHVLKLGVPKMENIPPRPRKK